MASCTALQAAIQLPASRKQTIIAKWCSTRAASRTVLSPRPQSGSRTTTGSSCAVPIAGASSARSRQTTKAAYRATSSQVRLRPPKRGRFGKGASLIVPGRRKCRKAVNGGQM
jgi:hypothetical protein